MAVQADGRFSLGAALPPWTPNRTFGSPGSVRTVSVESGFTASANDSVYALAIQPDGKILVGGDFTSLGGQTRVAFGRLNTNGTLDTGFNPHVLDLPPINTVTARAQAILLQPDGKIVLGGPVLVNGGPAASYIYG